MDRYIALLHKEEGSSFGIMFPDFPGCISAGDTMEEALDSGREALSFHVEGMRNDGLAIPRPRSSEEIKLSKEDWLDFNNATFAVISLLPPKEGTERVNLTIDRGLLAEADAAASRVNETRSAFFARAVRSVLEESDFKIKLPLSFTRDDLNCMRSLLEEIKDENNPVISKKHGVKYRIKKHPTPSYKVASVKSVAGSVLSKQNKSQNKQSKKRA